MGGTGDLMPVVLLLAPWVSIVGCYWESGWQMYDPQPSSAAFCGNGVVEREGGETCDGNCPEFCGDGNPCIVATMGGSAEECNVVCSYRVINECRDGDACCPAGCNKDSDKDCSASCGDWRIDANETCDPPGSCMSDCEDEDPCTNDIMTGSAENCNVFCSHHDVNACQGGDRCCPTGCGNSDSDCQSRYPAGPYGTGVGDTIGNFCVEECLCSGNTLTGSREVCAEEFVGAKATMVIDSAGTCHECKVFAQTLQDQYYDVYEDRGLEILYILFQDDHGNESRDPLFVYCCNYKDSFGMTFAVTIDPKDRAMGRYHDLVPMTMLLDPNMKIIFKEDGVIPDSQRLKQAIEDMLSGD